MGQDMARMGYWEISFKPISRNEQDYFLNTKLRACVCVSLSVMSDSLQCHGLYIALQASLSMEFSRQEYWSGLSFPSPGNFPDPGVKLGSPALLGDFFTIWATQEAQVIGYRSIKQSCLSNGVFVYTLPKNEKTSVVHFQG